MEFYLDVRSRKQLITKTEEQMVKLHVDTILSKGFSELMANDRKEHLKRMYNLISAVGELEKLKTAFASYIVVRRWSVPYDNLFLLGKEKYTFWPGLKCYENRTNSASITPKCKKRPENVYRTLERILRVREMFSEILDSIK